MKRYLFAKYLKDLAVEELMEKVAMAGLDGPTALIREGYWITENNLKNIGFHGPLIFMPFYNTDNVDMHCSILKKEVDFIDKIISTIKGKMK